MNRLKRQLLEVYSKEFRWQSNKLYITTNFKIYVKVADLCYPFLL